MFDYLEKVLLKAAQEGERYVLSGKLRTIPEAIHSWGNVLVDAVIGRTCRLASGQDKFCRYYGREGANVCCSECNQGRFCRGGCVTQGHVKV